MLRITQSAAVDILKDVRRSEKSDTLNNGSIDFSGTDIAPRQ